MDETGLFYRALPDKTLTVRGADWEEIKRKTDCCAMRECCWPVRNSHGDWSFPQPTLFPQLIQVPPASNLGCQQESLDDFKDFHRVDSNIQQENAGQWETCPVTAWQRAISSTGPAAVQRQGAVSACKHNICASATGSWHHQELEMTLQNTSVAVCFI